MRASLLFALLFLSSLALISATKRGNILQRAAQPPPPPPASDVYLWPLPSSVSNGNVARSVSVPLSIDLEKSFPDLIDAVARFNAIAFPHRATGDPGSDAISSLYITVADNNAPLQLGVDESYRLRMNSDPLVILNAPTYYGVLHGLETLSQLIYFNFTTGTYFIPSTPWNIADSPRFSHRGILVDTSRHYQTLPIIRRIVDSLAFAKYNVFHWHLSDSQSFPWGPESLPRLSMAAYSQSERYSSADIADVVEYARQRGVRVMLEFDVPGHAGSWCVGYPEVCPAPTCTQPLDPSSNATFALLQTLMTEVTGGRKRAGLVPEDLIHLGGDEVDLSCWSQTPRVASWLKANNFTAKDAYRYIVEGAHDIVYAAGRTPVNWDEVYDNFGKVWRLHPTYSRQSTPLPSVELKSAVLHL
jgi:hexosaminidase